MKSLMKSEFYKLVKSNYAYILFFLPAVMAAFSLFMDNFAPPAFKIESAEAFIASAFGGDINVHLFGIFIAIFIASDFHSRKMEEMVASHNRQQIFITKLLVSFIFIFIHNLFLWGISSLLGSMYFSSFSWLKNSLPFYLFFIFMQTFLACASASIYTMFSFIVQNRGVAICINIFFYMALNLVVNTLGIFHPALLEIKYYFPTMLPARFLFEAQLTIQNICLSVIICIPIMAISVLAGVTVFKTSDIRKQ